MQQSQLQPVTYLEHTCVAAITILMKEESGRAKPYVTHQVQHITSAFSQNSETFKSPESIHLKCFNHRIMSSVFLAFNICPCYDQHQQNWNKCYKFPTKKPTKQNKKHQNFDSSGKKRAALENPKSSNTTTDGRQLFTIEIPGFA